MVALLLLGQRLVRLALRRELDAPAPRAAAAIAFSCSLRILPISEASRSPPTACSSAMRRCSAVDLGPVRGVDARQLGLPRALRGRHRLAVLVVQLGQLGAVSLLRPRPAAPPLGAQALVLAARPRLLLRHALLEGVDLLARLAQLLVRVVEPRLEPLLALGRLLAILRQLGHPLVGGDQVALEPQRALLQIAPRAIELPDLVLVVEDLALLRVQRVAKIENVLLFLVDDLAQPQELALLRERGGLREPLPRLLDLLAQCLPLVLERLDPRLQLGVARLGLSLPARVVDEPLREHRGAAASVATSLELDLLRGAAARRLVARPDRRGHRGRADQRSGPSVSPVR